MSSEWTAGRLKAADLQFAFVSYRAPQSWRETPSCHPPVLRVALLEYRSETRIARHQQIKSSAMPTIPSLPYLFVM